MSMSRATTPTIGKLGHGLYFDGVDDLINMGSPVALDNLTNFSYGAWVNVLGPWRMLADVFLQKEYCWRQ